MDLYEYKSNLVHKESPGQTELHREVLSQKKLSPKVFGETVFQT